MKHTTFCILVLGHLFPSLAIAEQDVHQHGVAAINLVIDDSLMQIELQSPAMNIVGFEHEATTEAEKATIESAVKLLQQPQKLFSLPAEAGCIVRKVEVEQEEEDHHDEDHEEDHHDEGHDEDHHDEEHDEEHEEDHHDEKHSEGDAHEEMHEKERHTEFHAQYTLACSKVEAIDEIALPLFDLFPAIEEIHLRAITPWGQISADIESSDKLGRLR